MKVLKNFANYFQCSLLRKSDIVKPQLFFCGNEVQKDLTEVLTLSCREIFKKSKYGYKGKNPLPLVFKV
jgi:hypothetical protein